VPHEEIAPGVIQIDTLLGDWERVTAGFLITGPRPVLVETGSQTSVPAVRRALDELGVGPNDLAGIAVTHIHLDHAGGVGDLAQAYPEATVYVHEQGARHLHDPSRLVNSAAQVYGPLLDSLYGRLEPTEGDRLKVLLDGEEIDVGGRILTAVDSPGHAKHHLAFHDSDTGVIFVGDAVGVRLPDAGVLRPSTPPPDFNLDQALDSLRKFADRSPTEVALAHYGLVPSAQTIFEEAKETLVRWYEVAFEAWKEGADIAAAFEERFASDLTDVPPEHKEKMETLNGVHSNAAGFRRFIEKREEHRHE
jgi:glyoxylase-like metal-dependent hydrolase (beta-lactamase superfamily II)